MGIFDLFSSGPGIKAANQAYKAATGGYNTGFNQAQDFTTNALNQATGTLTGAQNQQLAALQQGTGQAAGALQQGIEPWQKLFGQYYPAAQTYFGALGVGTPEQVAAARGTFQASPGYQYTLDQGLESVDRRRAATGNLAGATPDELAYAHNLSNQDYQQWLTNLAPSISGEQNAAGGSQSGYGALANLFSGAGTRQADVYGNTGVNIANFQSGAGNTLADLAWKKALGVGAAGAQKASDIFGAKTSASSNTLNALFGLGGLGASIYGMMPSAATGAASAYDTASNPYNLPWLA